MTRTGTFDTVSQGSIADAQRTWSHAKKKLRRQFRKNARQLLEDVVDRVNYEPWSEDHKIDFVLVYQPIKKYMDSSNGLVDANPRQIDQDDIEELKKGEKGDKAAIMRVEYINLLRENGLEIEIENFCSKFEEYRAIKICGTDYAMDNWAEKFLLMKPVEPPFGAVLTLEHDKPVDRMIAMYNECLYELPPPEHDDIDNHRTFDASRYVPQTLKSAVKSVIGKFKSESTDAEGDYDSRLKAQMENGLRKKGESEYRESAAFKQLTFQNERYHKLWTTKIENAIFSILHRSDDRLNLTKDNLLARAIRAPFNYSKKTKFLGHDDPEFYNRSERSLMVFRILENPEANESKLKASYKLSDMYREGCFETAYPLHAGGYKIRSDVSGKKQKWSEINIEEQIDNPRKLLRYFWSSSHMKWKFQPLNIVRNYFGSVTAMYFAYVGFYNMSLVIPAIAGTAVFIYGLLQMTWTDTARHICESGEKYLMCADCYIDGTCNATYLSDYCFTTSITSVANNGAVIVFSIIMMAWLAIFVTFWKRQQSTIAHTWGTTNSRSASAEVRVKYKLTKTKVFRWNDVTKTREQHITFLHRLPQYFLGFTVVAILLAMAVMMTLTITVYNYSLSLSIQRAKDYNPFTRKYANEIAICVTGSLSATLIICLSYVYRIIANKLTNMENHRTQRDHDNHLSFKIYLFEFVNYYSTLFYIAFFKGNITSPSNPRYLYGTSLKIQGCAPGGCMSEVSIQMILIMSVKQLVPILKDIIRTLNINRIQEELKLKLLSPFVGCCEFAQRWKNMAKQNLEDFKNSRSQYVQDFELAEPTEMYQEYVNNIIQLGFLTMFVTAFPLAPLICLFINIWQLRQDATRYVKRVRRPIGFRSEGIGTWMNILEVLSRIAILVNAILIAFTFDWLPLMIYKRNYETEGSSYVDFMLASHDFVREESDGSQTNQTCRYWSYIQPARADQSRFWLELMLARMLFIFLFQNLVWAAVRVIELLCDSTPKFVKERMVLEEKIAQEWLSSDDDSGGEDEVGDDESATETITRAFMSKRKPNLKDTHRRTKL
ncbi:anoctamin-7-like [Bolinopsis microptera]|uniref:anoctamin-7-like n=1 Tax=Bolinopsis microptera TaxID=2820187 RepID=UPI003079E53A